MDTFLRIASSNKSVRSLLPLIFAALTIMTIPFNSANAQGPNSRDLNSDTWVAVDALGRATPISGEVRKPRPDKFVGIFYFVWQGHHGTPGPFDITKHLADPDAAPWGPLGAFHWWGEPQIGYFQAQDPWVIRHNLSMLQDAGVDVLIIDVTNAFIYVPEVTDLCKVATDMRAHGDMTPQIAFITHSAGADTTTNLYNEWYAKKMYPDLWFRWHGKPLILSDIDDKLKNGAPIAPEIKDFFTWRYSWAWDPGKNKWPWIDRYPQRPGWSTDPSVPEELPVSVASHPVLNIGRSYHDGAEPPLTSSLVTPDTDKGVQFAEQWKRLFDVDPEFAFVDGWNEWVAQRFEVKQGDHVDFLGKPLPAGDSFFVDAYNEEFSRDIQPMKGGYGDNYYFQLVDGIRKFKGVRALPKASPYRSIEIAGLFDQWNDVRPEYRDTVGDTAPRDFAGWGNLHYVDKSGRNDLTTMKVACDKTYVYFYVRTFAPITPFTGKNWMQLLINSDQNYATGWNGYKYVVNAAVHGAHETTLTRLADKKTWNIPYHLAGNEMMLRIPRALIGQSDVTRTSFDFHWVDNCPVGGDIHDFWIYGDSAPNGRFNYRYENEASRR
jgi:hypothetical protein